MTTLRFALVVGLGVSVLASRARADDPLFEFQTSLDAQARALSPSSKRIGGFLDGQAPKPMQWPYDLKVDQCYLFILKGDAPPFFMRTAPPKVTGVALKLEGPDNQVVAEQKTETGQVVVLGYCPAKPGRYTLRINATGVGTIVQAGYAAPGKPGQLRPDGTDTLAPARPAPPPDPTTPLKEIIAAKAAKALPAAKRDGFWADHTAGSEPDGWFKFLSTGNCYWFLAQGEAGVTAVALVLLGPDSKGSGPMDPADQKVAAKNMNQGDGAVLGFCPATTARYKLKAMGVGKGRYAIGTFAAPGQPGTVGVDGMPTKR